MRYLALACDYDGTLACDGQVSSQTLAALQRLAATGRKLILVTGRELQDIISVFPRCILFEWIVAENGALLYHPANGLKKFLASPPPPQFIARLKEWSVPLSVGDVIVSTEQPYETMVLDTIRQLGLELQVIFNKGALMVLPSGTSKASGLGAALKEMALSPHNVVAIGDAENDQALLALCECAVAVANALPMLKEQADFVTMAANGAGVTELIDEIIASDLQQRETTRAGHYLLLGTSEDGRPVRLPAFASNVLVAGSSDVERQNLATAFMESLHRQRYQFCLVDTRGNYQEINSTLKLGDYKRAPSVDEVIRLLNDPEKNALVNLTGVAKSRRPVFLQELFARVQQLRDRSGHPHWWVMDRAEDVFSKAWQPALLDVPQQLEGIMSITCNPESISRSVLSSVNTVLTIGPLAAATLTDLIALFENTVPHRLGIRIEPGEALMWLRHKPGARIKLKLALKDNPNADGSSSPRPSDTATR